MAERTVLIFLATLLVPASNVGSQESSDKFASVLTLLAQREEALGGIDVTVIKQVGPGPEWEAYSQARDTEKHALARLAGVPFAGKPLHQSHTQKLPDEQYRVLSDRLFERRRIDEAIPADRGILRSLYFDGSLWQTWYPRMTAQDRRASVLIERFVQESEVIPALSLGGPLTRLSQTTYTPYQARILPLSSHLKEVSSGGTVVSVRDAVLSDDGEFLELVFLESTTQPWKQPPRPIGKSQTGPQPQQPTPTAPTWATAADSMADCYCFEVRLRLDPKRGFAPRAAEGRLGILADGEKQKPNFVEATPPLRWKASWSDFLEPAANLWLPQRLQVETIAGVTLPDGADFTPATKDGKPVSQAGFPVPDISKARVQLFTISSTVYQVVALRINATLDEPLFPASFPPGTIVEDRTKGEVYQLTGVSPAINAALKKTVDTLGIPRPAKPRRLFTYFVIVIVNFALLSLVIMMVRRYRKRLS